MYSIKPRFDPTGWLCQEYTHNFTQILSPAEPPYDVRTIQGILSSVFGLLQLDIPGLL